MKNISYRNYDNRYIGRKTIKGTTVTVYGATIKETKNKLRMAINDLTSGLKKEFTPKKLLFKDWWNIWFRQEKEPFLKPKSLKDITNAFEKLKDIHNFDLNKITREKILNVFSKIEENRGKEKAFLYAKACFNYAFKCGKIKEDIFALIKTPPRVHKHKPAFRYEQQVEIIENLKDNPLYSVIIVYLCTGMRKNEFDFKNIEKHIDYENYVLKAVNLKGRSKEVRYKNILISKELAEFIQEHKEVIHSYNAESAYREFNLFLKEHKIPGSIVSCRHTYATNNFYLGNPELFISRNMGHSTSQITKDNYTDIDYRLSKEKIIKLYNNLYRLF